MATSAQAATASWSFDPPSYDFGTRMPGTGPSPPKAFTLTNTGDVELGVAGYGIGWHGEGPLDPELFSITSNTCDWLEPGESCVFEVVFNPASAGPKHGSLSVNTNSGGLEPTYAELSGAGAGPIVSVTPPSLTFAPVESGTSSEPETFTVANEGVLDLVISQIWLGLYPASQSEQFEVVGGTCHPGVTVPPSAECTIEAVFEPMSPGFFWADLILEDNAPGLPDVARAQGLGIEPPLPPSGPSPPVIVKGPPDESELMPRQLPSGWEVPTPRASVKIVHRPKATTLKRHGTFWFRGSPTAVRFECQIDNQPASACQAPVSYTNLRPGRHQFIVRGIDGLGVHTPTASYSWKILRKR